jgi:hypothetical protein
MSRPWLPLVARLSVAILLIANGTGNPAALTGPPAAAKADAGPTGHGLGDCRCKAGSDCSCEYGCCCAVEAEDGDDGPRLEEDACRGCNPGKPLPDPIQAAPSRHSSCPFCPYCPNCPCCWCCGAKAPCCLADARPTVDAAPCVGASPVEPDALLSSAHPDELFHPPRA